ncbi:hypothetical protein B0H16DRAFT_1464780 [Mycena metata]|uniref:Uncharacterized protein n=1 Tax=Mycena metata TaxID=1033252 RepID=A0AAD7IFI3_9AGAR|nr:hypothetical protein B0H16DRAFT_1464780 [Mycena metata]
MSARRKRRHRAEPAAEDPPVDPSQCVDDAAVESDGHGGAVESDLTEVSDDPGSLKDFIDDGDLLDDSNQDSNVQEDNVRDDDTQDDDIRADADLRSAAGVEGTNDVDMTPAGLANSSRSSADAESSSQTASTFSRNDSTARDVDPQDVVHAPLDEHTARPAEKGVADKRKRTRRRSNKAIRDSDSDIEYAGMAFISTYPSISIRMFSDPRGVKSSLLSPPLVTRRAASAAVQVDQSAPSSSSRTAAFDQPDTDRSSDVEPNQRRSKKPRVSPATPRSSATRTVKTMMQSELPNIADAVLARLLPALKDVFASATAPINTQPRGNLDKSGASSFVSDRAQLSLPAIPVEVPLTSVGSTSVLPLRPDAVEPSPMDDVTDGGSHDHTTLEPSAMDASPARDEDIARSSSKLPIGNGTPSRPKGKGTASDNASAKIDVSSLTFFNSSSSTSTPSPTKIKVLAGLEDMPSATLVKKEPADEAIALAGDGTFLDDLESYKLKYDPSYPCQVADPELQDKLLIDSYKGLPPLPGRRVLPSFTRNDSGEDDVKGGRVIFSVWPKVIKDCTATTITAAVTFEQAGPFINPSRVSPAEITVRPTKQGAKTTTHMRINVDSSVATCVSCGMCVESAITRTLKTFGSPPREYKCISLLMHNQDWERWAAWMCLCFNEQQLYSSLSGRAVQIRTMMSSSEDDNSTGGWAAAINPAIMKPVRSATSSPTKFKSKYALGHDELVPVYDCTKRDLDLDEELVALESLPRWRGEVPVGSFVVVGYSASTYPATVGGSGPKVAHLSCNLLWVIVCGIPK